MSDDDESGAIVKIGHLLARLEDKIGNTNIVDPVLLPFNPTVIKSIDSIEEMCKHIILAVEEDFETELGTKLLNVINGLTTHGCVN